MSILDVKVARCEVAKEMVFLDETQLECSLEHKCPPGTNCPLEGCFAKKSGIAEEHKEVI